MAARPRYTFLEKKHAPGAVFAITLSVISAAAFLVCALISGAYEGRGGIVLGAVGLCAALLAAYALFLALRDLLKYRYRDLRAKVAAVLSGAALLLWLILLIIGA